MLDVHSPAASNTSYLAAPASFQSLQEYYAVWLTRVYWNPCYLGVAGDEPRQHCSQLAKGPDARCQNEDL